MKKKILLSSIATIALCLCMIAGSTFALFTDKSEVGIAVTAAKVEMTASISELGRYSVKADKDGTIVDEWGGTYTYDGPLDRFANGGTANFEDGILTLDKITPGDKVSFQVTGTNTSDVVIQYRYIIECVGGEKLMSGLLVSIEGVTYELLGSYTSAWKTLNPQNNITPVPVVLEFPVTAGNEFQEEATSIKVTVEAVQGNADVVRGDKPVVEFLNNADVDLAGKTMTINAGVVNTGDLTLSNGTIAINEVGFENYGNATLTNIEINGGTAGTQAYGYAFISRKDSTAALEEVVINSANGGIGAVDGAQLTFNSGEITINSANTSQRYNFYASGAGTVIEINDGDFAFEAYKKRSYVCAINGAIVYINGGTFGVAPNHPNWKNPIYTDSTGTVIIKGGTFGFDPSAWVADGYEAIKTGTVWTVSQK